MLNTNVFAPDPFQTPGANKVMGMAKPDMIKAGSSLMQQAGQDREAMIAQLAATGQPPPQVQMPQVQGPGVGQALAGFQQALGVPRTMPTQSPGMAATNPSVGQLLSQGY